jgi:2-polyprenyl-3-methyl-5-hydroxy-6-metoxy-1,4-benzoquinol methylase
MAFGRRDPFAYFECSGCGCVQIAKVPDNLADYYPQEYFAFRPQHRLARSRIRAMVDGPRYRAATGEKSMLGALANRVAKPLDYVQWAQTAGLDRSAHVLDVGCGAGKLLVRMKHAGFRECTGVDPFIDNTVHYHNGVTVHRTSVSDFASTRTEPFNLIMLHHALEHMPDQRSVMHSVRRLLSPGGCVLIRIPVAGSYAWRTYRENWVT